MNNLTAIVAESDPESLGLFAISMLLVAVPLLVLAVWLLRFNPVDKRRDEDTPLILGSSVEQDLIHRRRRDAKQFNERLKSRVNFFNGLGIALFVAIAITLPQRGTGHATLSSAIIGLSAAVVMHILSLRALRGWKSEE